MKYGLKITCPDKPGLIASITDLISSFSANILDLAQHTAEDIDMFLLRAEFMVAEDFSETEFRSKFGETASKMEMEWSLFALNEKPQVAIFVSKTDHCLYELLLRHKDGELNCDFPCIISNHPDLQTVAGQFNIPFYHVPSNQDKPAQEKRFDEILKLHKVDTIVMARYMQILRKEFTEQWKNKIINIHHGFLPAFQGAKPYHQAWEKGVKIIGATAHFATEDLDQGPIITQDVEKVSDRASIQKFILMGKDVERRVLLKGLKLYLNHRVFVIGRRTFIMD